MVVKLIDCRYFGVVRLKCEIVDVHSGFILWFGLHGRGLWTEVSIIMSLDLC